MSVLRLFFLSVVVCLAACGSKSSKKTNNAAPPPAVNDPSLYPGSVLQPHVALNGMGQWVTIGGQQFFVPNMTLLQYQYRDQWAPYRYGYWSYDQNYGWTWVSNEPWGWMTDHYGIWRHHQQYGWVWLPFADLNYQPHTVTWFDHDDDDYIGWYPYYPEYAQGYKLGLQYGFNDGYWMPGYKAVLNLNLYAGQFTFGFTMVKRAHVTSRSLFTYVLRDRTKVLHYARRAFREDRIRSGRIGRTPGGHRDRDFDFIQSRATERARIGQTRKIKSRGGAQITGIRFDDDDNRDRNRNRDREANRNRDRRNSDRLNPRDRGTGSRDSRTPRAPRGQNQQKNATNSKG